MRGWAPPACRQHRQYRQYKQGQYKWSDVQKDGQQARQGEVRSQALAVRRAHLKRYTLVPLRAFLAACSSSLPSAGKPTTPDKQTAT
jgi:hypothetical protein